MRSPIRALALRAIGLAALSTVLLHAVPACDLHPDECDGSENACQGNVAVSCQGDGESQRSLYRKDCTSIGTCVITKDTGGQFTSPVCAEKGPTTCTENTPQCRPGGYGRCLPIATGGDAWVILGTCP